MSTRLRSHSDASSSNSTLPPSYPPSISQPPTYNPRPSPNEQSLQAGAVPPPDGVYSKKSKHFTLALTRQASNTDEGGNEVPGGRNAIPVYGRSEVVQGVIDINTSIKGFKAQDIKKVIFRIEGKIKLEIAEGGDHSFTFLDHKDTLFSLSSDTDQQPAPICPTMLPFAFEMPTSYCEPQPLHPNTDAPPPPPTKRALPPSYSVNFDGVPCLRAQVKYTLKIELVKKKFWKQKHLLLVPFNYVPRSRPHLPGPEPTASFLANLKASPDDWAVFSSPVPRRTDPTNTETEVPRPPPEGHVVMSSLVIPSLQTFPLTQSIPFHLQLSLSSAEESAMDDASKPVSSSKPSAPVIVTADFRPLNGSRRPPNPTQHSFASVAPNRRPATAPNPTTSPSVPPTRSHTTKKRKRPKTPPQPANSSTLILPNAPKKPKASHIQDPTKPLRTLITLFDDPDQGPRDPLAHMRVRQRPSGGTVANEREMRAVIPPGEAGGGTPMFRDISRVPPPPRKAKKGENVPVKEEKSHIRVFLQRQIVVTVRGQKVVKTVVCGDGKLQRVRLDKPPAEPPAFEERPNNTNAIPQTGGDGVEYIAWEGSVSPLKDMLTVGGFRASGLWVKDFITLTMVPPDPERSPLRALHHAVPVRLVTDAWQDEWWSGGRRM